MIAFIVLALLAVGGWWVYAKHPEWIGLAAKAVEAKVDAKPATPTVGTAAPTPPATGPPAA